MIQIKKRRVLCESTYLTVTFVTIFSHEVDTVTVFIPESAFVGQGTVGDSNVVVIVIGREGSALVVCHGVAWQLDRGVSSRKQLICFHAQPHGFYCSCQCRNVNIPVLCMN